MSQTKYGVVAEWGEAALTVLTLKNIQRWFITALLLVISELCQRKLGMFFEKLGEAVLILIVYLLADSVWTYVTRRYSHWKKRSAVE